MLRFFNLWFLLSLLFILNSCLYTANSPPNKKLILQDDKRNYRQLYVSFFDSIEKINKTANSYAPAGTYSYSYASAFNRDKSDNTGHYIGYGYDPGDSEKLALEFCEKNKHLLKNKKTFGFYKSNKKPEIKKCKVILTERYESEIYYSSTGKCLDLGIVEHPNHLKCVNHFEKIRGEIIQKKNSSSSFISVADVLSSLLILEIALTSLQPNTVNSGVTCMMTSTALTGSGGLNGISCY